MSSATMASSSVSQEDLENDFERSSRRSRIRMARGRDVRCHQAATCRTVGEPVAETEDGPESRPLDPSGYSGDHDASPKPAARAKDKRPVRQSHINKGKQQRDRRKLREKRRSTGVVHMPSTEVSSTGGSTNDDDNEEQLAGVGTCAETRRNTQQNEFLNSGMEEPAAAAAHASAAPRQYPRPFRNKGVSDMDADDEDNQDTDPVFGEDCAVAAGAIAAAVSASKSRQNGQMTAATSAPVSTHQLEEENRRLVAALEERDQRIVALEATLARFRAERQHLRQENTALVRAMEALSTQ